MNISVLIPVSTDLRLRRCIESIDEPVEVVISLNKPSAAIEKMVSDLLRQQKEDGLFPDLSFVVCRIEYPSIAQAYNNGIAHATHPKILLMDSDCVFDPGTIKKLDCGLKDDLLSKGLLKFETTTWSTKVVAKAREYHSTDTISAYSPPLLFDKSIKGHIGDFYFHPSLCWLEDSEFDSRVQKAKLKINYDPSATIRHPVLTPRRDLKSAFWYGVGKRIGVVAGVHIKPTGLLGSIKKYLFEATKKKGLAVGVYLFTWKMMILLGYNIQNIFRIRPYDREVLVNE